MNRHARFLLKRLTRRLEGKAIQDFVRSGHLEVVDHLVDGGVVRFHRPSNDFPVLSGEDAVDLECLRRIAAGWALSASRSADQSDCDHSFGKPERKSSRRKKLQSPAHGAQTATGSDGKVEAKKADDTPESYDRELRLLRQLARRPSTGEIVAVLLVARMLNDLGPDERELLSDIMHGRRSSGILVLKSDVSNVEPSINSLIQHGVIAPRGIHFVTCSGVEYDFSAPPQTPGNVREIPVVRFDSDISTTSGDDVIRIKLAHAMKTEHPVLHLTDDPEPLPSRLLAATDLHLRIAPFDWELIAETAGIIIGHAVHANDFMAACSGLKPATLSFDDITLALRPGRSLTEVTRTLRSIAADIESDDVEPGDGRKNGDRRGKDTTGGGGRSGSPVKKSSTGSDLVKPVPDFVTWNTKTGQPVLRVENLHGYGEARIWALDLRADLALWQAGEARWSDLSTKLLLSGPPGTGKTTFARALCNTLQLPLLVTSMARWLEGGHLGDVLKSMAAAFGEAKEYAPCILFIDEIDNLGKRGGSNREYDEYWQSLVNRMLELLDGAVKREGIIVVGATNLPDRIDSALLRSGRLEKHIVIPPPDTAALVGILAHHLGPDLTAVIKTAPPAQGMADLPVPYAARHRSSDARSDDAHVDGTSTAMASDATANTDRL